MTETPPARALPPGPPPFNNVIGLLYLMYQVNQHNAITLIQNGINQYGDTFVMTINRIVQFWSQDADFAYEVLVKQAAHFNKDRDYRDQGRGLARFLGNGLLTSNGDFWKRQRKLAAPAFHAKRIEAYANTMVGYGQQQMAGWREGQRLDMSREMSTVTMRIVAKSLFDVEVIDIVEMVTRSMAVIQESAIVTQTSPLPTWVPTPLELRARRAVRDLDEFVYKTIAEWRKTGVDKGDLLSMLLLAEDDEGQHMTDEQARDEIVTLFLAGHETTANTLNWTWTLLAQHPDIEAKLHAELDSVLQGRPPTLADLRRLPYTDMVIKESMRLYPPAWTFSRETLQDVTIAGFNVPKGAVAALYVYGLHRNPKYWGADADVFRPERFLPEESEGRHKYAYIPFGAGPRVCIGFSFATMEANLLLATFAQQWQMRLAPGQTVEMQPLITLNPKGGLPLTLEKRTPVYDAPKTALKAVEA